MSLRGKFVLFLSLIITATCSGLSAYFIHTQRTQATTELIELGTILGTNLAHNGRFGLITEDPVLLDRLIEGAMEVDEVVYVIITGPDGRELGAKSKGTLLDRETFARDARAPLFPVNRSLSAGTGPFQGQSPIAASFTAPGGEVLYDFTVPVIRKVSGTAFADPLALESAETHRSDPSHASDQALGVFRIGLTSAKRDRLLWSTIWNVALLTAVIIIVGVLATSALAGRIIIPLKSLSAVARRVAHGDLAASVTATTNDEVGQLAHVFNKMTKSLSERDQAISNQVSVIRKQIRQLTSLNQSASAIASTLDIDKLLDVVLDLCVENVGFKRMVLGLYDSNRGIAFGLHVIGVSEEIERIARTLEIPVRDEGGTDADLLVHGKSLLVKDIEEIADRLFPPVLDLCRRADVVSFVGAPLRSKGKILGCVCGDFGERRCTQEDLDLLTTIGNHIAVAIDNARAYQSLESLTQTLELRVQERTRELEVANQRLVELDKLRAAFVSIVSHELRTPMTSIKGYVENMLDGLTGPLTDRQSYYLTRVKYNVERLTRMLNQLLDLSRIEAGRVELHRQPVSLAELVEDAVEGLQPLAQSKSITLSSDITGELPPILADRDKLHQVFTNLVGNAIKFTPQWGHVQVEVTGGPEGEIRVCVSDTGCGIALHERERVFEKFYRGETAPQEAVGAGLGLPITKHLVELHGGRIWVESVVGIGSQFYFTIPILPHDQRSEPS